jgi:hypothetical protein
LDQIEIGKTSQKWASSSEGNEIGKLVKLTLNWWFEPFNSQVSHPYQIEAELGGVIVP